MAMASTGLSSGCWCRSGVDGFGNGGASEKLTALVTPRREGSVAAAASVRTERLPSLQPRDRLDSCRREPHRDSSLLHKTQQVEAAQIAFGNGARPDASCVGDLD